MEEKFLMHKAQKKEDKKKVKDGKCCNTEDDWSVKNELNELRSLRSSWSYFHFEIAK
jgi:hypothetical protein